MNGLFPAGENCLLRDTRRCKTTRFQTQRLQEEPLALKQSTAVARWQAHCPFLRERSTATPTLLLRKWQPGNLQLLTQRPAAALGIPLGFKNWKQEDSTWAFPNKLAGKKPAFKVCLRPRSPTAYRFLGVQVI